MRGRAPGAGVLEEDGEVRPGQREKREVALHAPAAQRARQLPREPAATRVATQAAKRMSAPRPRLLVEILVLLRPRVQASCPAIPTLICCRTRAQNNCFPW